MNIFELLSDKYTLPTKPILFEAFSGIGCQRMAFNRLGIDYESIGFSEIDKYAIQSYNAIHGDTKNFGSICDIKGTDLPQIDVFTWSFPCTDLSKAGKQKGLTNTRSGLVYEVLRIMQECKVNGNLPKVLIMENVVDLVQVKFIREFQAIQLELENLGYTNYTQTLNAKDYGVAQNRDRVFMVSILGNYYYEFPQPIKLEKRLKDYLESKIDPKYYLSDKQIESMKNAKFESMGLDRVNADDDVCNTITTMSGGNREPKVSIVGNVNPSGNGMNGNVFNGELSPTLTTNKGEGIKIVEPSVVVIGNYSQSNHDASRIVDNNGLAPAVKENYGTVTDTQELVIYDDYNQKIRDDQNTIGTLTTNCGSGTERNGYKLIENNLRIRKLTPLECWRLMGIDDKDFHKASQVCSNSQLYKQAGNGIVVDVFASILKTML